MRVFTGLALEIGEWDPTRDLKLTASTAGSRVELTLSGQSRCNPVGCPITTALLDLQDGPSMELGPGGPVLSRRSEA